jgi:hypothetical protein
VDERISSHPGPEWCIVYIQLAKVADRLWLLSKLFSGNDLQALDRRRQSS